MRLSVPHRRATQRRPKSGNTSSFSGIVQTWEKQANLTKTTSQQIRWRQAGPRGRHAGTKLLQRRIAKTLGKTKGNHGSLRSRCVTSGVRSEASRNRKGFLGNRDKTFGKQANVAKTTSQRILTKTQLSFSIQLTDPLPTICSFRMGLPGFSWIWKVASPEPFFWCHPRRKQRIWWEFHQKTVL